MELHTAYENDRSVLQNCAVYLEKEKKWRAKIRSSKVCLRQRTEDFPVLQKSILKLISRGSIFKQIIHEANKRLLTMSNHQFILKLKEEANTGRKTNEGLDLSVYSLVTDSERDVKTLSGGGIISRGTCDGTRIVRYRGAERRGDPPGYDVYR